VERAFIVLRSRGPAWDDSKPMEAQADWAGHAAFIDALFEQGIIALVGPVEGTRDALLVFRAAGEAEVVDRLAADPWSSNGLLATKQISPWEIRLGTLDSKRG
jgi:uncharacterized protein YciI